MRHAAAVAVIGSFAMSSIVWAEPITTGSLVREMIDMPALAEFPSPFFETVQFSSYDHRSTLPEGPEWFANSDGFGREPVPNFAATIKPQQGDVAGEYLICDVNGPGAIVRLWTAAISGGIRMVLDDAEKPIYDGPAQLFFQHVYRPFNEGSGVDNALFVGTFAQRDACYLPIPFARRCRIIWTGKLKEIHFYQVQIRRYDPKAEVVTFKPEDLKTFAGDIRSVAKTLQNPQVNWPYRSKQAAVPLEGVVGPGQTTQVLGIKGPKAIERLTLKLSAVNLDLALRQTILHITFDGYPHAQVESPVGDFFGAAPGINPYNSVPFTVEPDGTMTCRYVMPFAKSCELSLRNLGDQAVTVKGSAAAMEYPWKEASSMHFRARWRADHDLVAEGGERAQDMPFMLASGAGRYVGTALMLLNPNNVPTPGGNWWGEGDEKIFVDQDVQPSTFGTGSEDYFNYSWSSPDIFVFPYCGQPRNDGPANRGFVTNYRWHILDNLPFRSRLDFYMELFSHERTPGTSYMRIGYHYGRPGLIDDHRTITAADARPLRLPANWQPAARGGASNSVFYEAEKVLTEPSRANAKTDLVRDELWSGGQMLVWRPSKVSEPLTFLLPVEKDGDYHIHLTMARTPRSGKVSVRFNGQRCGFGGDAGMDLFEAHRTLSRDQRSGSLPLKAGSYELELRYEGPGQAAEPAEIGVDFLWVQRR